MIKSAIEEDVKTGDITTKAAIPESVLCKGEFIIKQDGIIAGLEIAKEVFNYIDKELQFTTFSKDGEPVKYGNIAAIVTGKAVSVLTAERTALNFMQRMSGIATLANQYQSIISHTKAKIIDTRKTVPGLRILDKMAVKMGGCENHRIGLYDMFLIKDNHIAAAGSITNAINRCKEFNHVNNTSFKIEVETENLEQVKEALECGVDVIMLDNFEVPIMAEAVKIIGDKSKIEASGGINLETVKDIAETGVDFISVGALTHSVIALDISLEITI
ncbi:MAG: carboxylating nicotinate-nucleotide diphosphorylase [Bacteroidota bacterium]|nr:carboxylating nicotinate-nucleotide diphosphorylase [Bacteroidota bacterium]